MNDDTIITTKNISVEINPYETVLTHLMAQTVNRIIFSYETNKEFAELISELSDDNSAKAFDKLKQLVGLNLYSTFTTIFNGYKLDKFLLLGYIQDGNGLSIYRIQQTIRAKDELVKEFLAVYERKMIRE